MASVTLRRAYDAVGFLPALTLGVNPTDRRIIALAMPALGSLAVEPLYVLVDTAIVGRLGTAQLGGLAVAATVLALVVAGCNFLTYGTTERVARRLGAGDGGGGRRRRRADDVAVGDRRRRRGAVIAFSAPVVVRLARRQRRRLDFAVTYLRIGGDRRAVRHRRDRRAGRTARRHRLPHAARRPARRPTSSTPCSRCVFVFGFDWGVAGSAWSTVIAQVGAGVAFAGADPPPPRRRDPPPAELGGRWRRCSPPAGTCCCASARCSP